MDLDGMVKRSESKNPTTHINYGSYDFKQLLDSNSNLRNATTIRRRHQEIHSRRLRRGMLRHGGRTERLHAL
jgi:hypothetical protein